MLKQLSICLTNHARWRQGMFLVLSVTIGWRLCLPAVQAQQANGISEPASGSVVSGIVIITGTADDLDFLRYELAFLQEGNAAAGWIVFAQGDLPVISGTLAVWDTSVGRPGSRVFPDGRYRLRLRVVRSDYNYDEYFTTELLIANDTATPSPTPTEEGTIPEQTAVEGERATREATTLPNADILPSLTPFPTPTSLPTPASITSGIVEDRDGGQGTQSGLLERATNIDVERIGRSFWSGVTIVLIAFGFFGSYFLLRGLLRRLWRIWRHRMLP